MISIRRGIVGGSRGVKCTCYGSKTEDKRFDCTGLTISDSFLA